MARLSILTLVVLCPLALAGQSSVHPVVDTAVGCLLGGSAGGKWLSDDDLAPRLQGGEKYRLMSDNGIETEATGGKPASAGEPCPGAFEVALTGTSKSKSDGIAVSATWKLHPRAVHDITANKRQYEQLLAPELAKIGVTAKAQVRQLFRVDLDGDGVFSVVGVLGNFSYAAKDAEKRASRYSVAFVRQVVKGRVVTVILDSDKGDHEGGTSELSIAGIADLKGDSHMEVVVRGHYLQGGYSTAYAVENGKASKVLSCACGE